MLLARKLYREPLLLFACDCIIISLLKPHPTVADAAMFMVNSADSILGLYAKYPLLPDIELFGAMHNICYTNNSWVSWASEAGNIVTARGFLPRMPSTGCKGMT